VPNGPNALRAYAPARTTAAERPPRASWAFFCAADADDDADDEVDDNGVEVEEKGDVARRRRGACRVRRKVVTIMSFCFVFLPFFFRRERAKGVLRWW
jgi:hypothetical protein